MANNLEKFEQFMQQHLSWTLINKTDKILSYQKVIPGKKASCLITLILLCFAIIPGLLYLYFANKPTRTYTLSVSLQNDGSLAPSGDAKGLSLYQKFLHSQS